LIYNTKDGKGNEIQKEINFIDPMTHKDMEEFRGYCYLCGEQTTYGMKLKKIFSNVFTDWNIGKCRTSTHVCPACCFTILTTKEHYGIRTFSNVANKDRLYLPNRVEMREFLLHPPDPPFVINLAVSKKKHIAFKGEVNYSKDIFTVMYEEMPVLIDRKDFTRLLELVEHFLYGFTKTEITTGEYNQKRILNFGIEAWEAFEKRIKKYRGSPLLDVVMFVAQKVEEEEKLQCYMVSELKMNMQEQQHYLSMPSTEAGIGKEDQTDRTCGGKSNDSQKSVPNEQLALDLF
jgi:hypothetical protein